MSWFCYHKLCTCLQHLICKIESQNLSKVSAWYSHLYLLSFLLTPSVWLGLAKILQQTEMSPAPWCVGACFMRNKLTFSCQCCVLYRFPTPRELGVARPAPANLSCMCRNVLIDSQRSPLAENVLAYLNFRFRLRVATATRRLLLQIAAVAVWLGAHLAQDKIPPHLAPCYTSPEVDTYSVKCGNKVRGARCAMWWICRTCRSLSSLPLHSTWNWLLWLQCS